MIAALLLSISANAATGTAATGDVATLACPPGPTWTRERQQRPPVVEPAPLTAVRLEKDDVVLPPLATHRWRLDPSLRYALVCTYAEGAENIVIVTGVSHLRVHR